MTMTTATRLAARDLLRTMQARKAELGEVPPQTILPTSAHADMIGVLVAGDTGYGPEFKAIGEKFGPLDMALLPVGGYEPRWYAQPMQVDPAQAVQIHKDLGVKRSVAVHWGTFDLSTEAIDAARTDLPKALAAAGLSPDDFLLMQSGETAIWRVEKAPDLAGTSRAHPKREWRKGEAR